MISTIPNSLAMILRVLVACICGGAVGFERTKRLKEAGVRTHCIIAAASALLMIVSKYGFADLAGAGGAMYAGTRGADSARIAAQVVSGISFLGAGVIFKNGNSVKGLTTAAGIWATAAIGLAVGAGMYVLGFVGTGVVVIVQLLFHRFNVGNDVYSETDVHVTVVENPEFEESLSQMIRDKQVQIVSMRIDRQADGTSVSNIVLRTRSDIGAEGALAMFREFPGIRSVSI